MSKPYSRMLGVGAEEAIGATNYYTYQSNSANHQTKRLKGGTPGPDRPSEVLAYISPFDEPVAVGSEYVIRASSYLQPSSPAPQNGSGAVSKLVEALVTTQRVRFVVPPGENLISLPPGYKPARATIFQPDGNKAYVQAKKTKLFFLKYSGHSHSGNYGKAGAAIETNEQAAATVKAAIAGTIGGARYWRISVIPERPKLKS